MAQVSERMSTILPKIKCSMCARDIEISRMGEHVCSITPESTPPLEKDRSFGNGNNNKTGFLKPRVPLARVDTAAANRPFLRNDEIQRRPLTPVSGSSSYHTLSPYSSVGGKSPQPLLRSATAPLPQTQTNLPTPEEVSGTFIPFNQARTASPSPRNVEFQDSNFLGGQRFEEPEQYAPVSPRSADFLSRMNTLSPGPFDMRGGPNRPSSPRSMTSRSQDSYGNGGLVSPRLPREGGYEGFGPPSPRKEPSDSHRSNAVLSPRTTGPDLSRPLPRGTENKDGMKLAEKPAPGIDLESEFGSRNPYHSASESMSSTASSSFSHNPKSNGSSFSSISSSVAGPRRQPSNDIDSSILELRPKELPSTSRPFNLDTRSKGQPARNLPSPISGSCDPAIQEPFRAPTLHRPANSTNTRRPQTAKGTCKGCNSPIKAGEKSVSSADGRLTGRYHKECFVCWTCSEPFATATFYVLNDAPYCERHYHRKNNSMCTACDRGIEGQYLETQRRQKFHPGCLKCSDCKRTLKRDYFEMNNRVYCERDAFRRAQQKDFLGPGGATSKMERRTTRLMMM